jgi:hypothetical protein
MGRKGGSRLQVRDWCFMADFCCSCAVLPGSVTRGLFLLQTFINTIIFITAPIGIILCAIINDIARGAHYIASSDECSVGKDVVGSRGLL